ncbi:MAG: hypothetical protein AB8G11_05350 [Saprospiraceae bacterium]
MKTTFKVLIFCLVIVGFQSCDDSASTEQESQQTQQIQQPQAVEAEQEANPFLVTTNSFYGFTIGEKFGDLEKFLMQTGEGDFDVFLIKDENGEKLGHIDSHYKDESLVGGITITTEKAVTEDGVKIGMTYADFNAKFPNAELHGSEIEGYTSTNVNKNVYYELSDRHWEYELDKSAISKDATIVGITVH